MAAIQTKSFTGKVALVTGGSRGIGAGIVCRLAADGASVAFTYSSSEERPANSCSNRSEDGHFETVRRTDICGIDSEKSRETGQQVHSGTNTLRVTSMKECCQNARALQSNWYRR
jgi:NAD(P)-dependent dehydrogenase (short-subunit alcohol dehydrogenase family)